MLGHQKPKSSMFQMVTVDELVPQDHFLRQLDAAVDFSFIRDRVRPLYCEDNGRPSIDPELALRMFILSYLYDISENRLCNEIAMHADIAGSVGLTSTIEFRTDRLWLRFGNAGECTTFSPM